MNISQSISFDDKVILAMLFIYQKVSRYVGNLLANFMISFLLLFFTLVLIYLKYKAKKRNNKIAITKDNYPSIKTRVQRIDDLHIKIESIKTDFKNTNMSFKEFPWAIRLFFNKLGSVINIEIQKNADIKQQLASLDENLAQGVFLKSITEDQLWQRRNKAYSYRY